MRNEKTPALEALLSRFPLPEGWSVGDVFEQTLALGDLRVPMVGLMGRHEGGAQVLGSAAQLEGDPLPRAFFELIERTSVVEWEKSPTEQVALFDETGSAVGWEARAVVCPESPEPETWRFSRSNGVAVGTTFGPAAAAAERELCERDRILRSWYGQSVPRRASLPELPPSLADHYEMECYLFPPGENESARLQVAALFGFARSSAHPLIYGAGAATRAEQAAEGAARECLQRLAFLWGEEMPLEEPPFAPTPAFHQELFLLPQRVARLRPWLKGAHFRPAGGKSVAGENAERTLFVEITPPALRGKLAVVKAFAPAKLPLAFGRCPLYARPDLPAELLIHPFA